MRVCVRVWLCVCVELKSDFMNKIISFFAKTESQENLIYKVLHPT